MFIVFLSLALTVHLNFVVHLYSDNKESIIRNVHANFFAAAGCATPSRLYPMCVWFFRGYLCFAAPVPSGCVTTAGQQLVLDYQQDCRHLESATWPS